MNFFRFARKIIEQMYDELNSTQKLVDEFSSAPLSYACYSSQSFLIGLIFAGIGRYLLLFN